MEKVGISLAAIGTLAILSFAWKENRVYRFFEHIFIGSAAAHALVMGINTIRTNAVDPMLAGKFALIIPIILGLLLYMRFFKSARWMSRYPIAFVVGLGTGMTIRGTIMSQFITQLKASMLPLTTFNNWVIVIGTSAVMLFFYFSKERKGITERYASIGRMIMMIAFGATFGGAVMSEMTLLTGRIQFLLGDWLQIIR